MPAKKTDITIERGANFDQVWEWYVSSGGAAVDVTGYTARMQVRPAAHVNTYFASLYSTSGDITLGGAAGTVRVQMASAVTSAIPGSGVYDLELTSPTGTVTRLAQGKAIIDDEVTR